MHNIMFNLEYLRITLTMPIIYLLDKNKINYRGSQAPKWERSYSNGFHCGLSSFCDVQDNYCPQDDFGMCRMNMGPPGRFWDVQDEYEPSRTILGCAG